MHKYLFEDCTLEDYTRVELTINVRHLLSSNIFLQIFGFHHDRLKQSDF
jgi:hypothetical protein